MADEKRIYYNKWYDMLTKEEQKEADTRSYHEGACQSEDRIGRICWQREYEKIEKKSKSSPPQPAKSKTIIDFIDDSDDEDEKVKPMNAKDHKIIKALECDFID